MTRNSALAQLEREQFANYAGTRLPKVVADYYRRERARKLLRQRVVRLSIPTWANIN